MSKEVAKSVGLIDLENLRLSQDFGSQVGVKKKHLVIPVRKPDRQTFFRVHRDETFRVETAILEIKEDNEVYLVGRDLWNELPGEIIPVVLLTCITRQKTPFLWHIRLPDQSGYHNPWHRSALEAAHHAMKFWIRIQADRQIGGYQVYEATGDLPEPEWPDMSFDEMVNTAFKGRLIESLEHPAIQKLRGLV